MIDNLYKRVSQQGPICLGLDTDLSYIPNIIKKRNLNIENLIFDFNKTIIDATIDIVPIYKLQIAYYESYGIQGLKAYKKTLDYIKYNGSLSIGDIKRGDIAASADMYARAHFEGDFETDMVTLNPYMGFETLDPFLRYLDKGKGAFVLLRTSNKGSKDIQYKKVEDNYLYYSVGDKLQEISRKFKGNCGYSNLGLVVGATSKEDGIEIRKKYNNMYFLIPGYGFQGGKGDDINVYLENCNGGVVNSSRGIILNYRNFHDGDEKFSQYTRQAVLDMKEDILGEIK